MAKVVINELKKSFDDTNVIRGIDLTIPDGEFVVLIGPSGCGKSTLLRMIAGLESVTDGTIMIGEKVVNDLSPSDRDIAMVFQSYALYPHMTVYENMAFSMKLSGVSKAEQKRRVGAAAKILNLTEYLDRRPSQLSGGQRQRVAMGRAIVRDPAVFLFDEPLSNLDAKLRIQMRTSIKEMHQRLKTTTVFVTHDQVEAMTMADTIVVMQNGKIEQSGRPKDLYEKPDNLFVATFIGSPAMNLIETTITRSATGSFVSLEGYELEVPDRIAASDSQKVTFGIRPEHLEVADQGIPATIKVIEPTGADTMLFTTVGDQEIVVLLRDWHDFELGQRIFLRPQIDRVHYFDSETSLRMDPL